MERLHRFILHPLTGKVFLYVLAGVYILYLAIAGHTLSTSLFTSAITIREYSVPTSSGTALQHWTVTNMQAATMQAATNADLQLGSAAQLTPASSDQSVAKGASQQGQQPSNKNLAYPLSTVGKVFFTNASGRDSMCSGTAVISSNHSVVDTAGHCLYLYGGWSQNVIFCPLYEHGTTPYGCWAARDLEVPSDWIDGGQKNFSHDFGIAVVTPNSAGNLTDVVGGAGWAYNQPANQLFYAYGYPAGYPFDGQTRQSCENSRGTLRQYGGGSVISIPCDMTGGSSGGPWFIQMNGSWYLNGHNDFISILLPKHMFSPYYDDTWYALYNKAQQA